MSTPAPSPIPHLHILCMDPACHSALTNLLNQSSPADSSDETQSLYSLPPGTRYTLHDSALSQHPSTQPFDLIVSPANSYGRLDGAFDDAISRAFSPRDDYLALTKVAQQALYRKYRGFAPPGSCTIVEIPNEWTPMPPPDQRKERKEAWELEYSPGKSKNVWGTRWLALCPTMRSPGDVTWDREVVYECIWSLLCAVGNHNRGVREKKEGEEEGEGEIRSLLMTPLATGIGKVTPERWAKQLVMAIRHYAEACEEEAKWSGLSWEDVEGISEEVEATWDT